MSFINITLSDAFLQQLSLLKEAQDAVRITPSYNNVVIVGALFRQEYFHPNVREDTAVYSLLKNEESYLYAANLQLLDNDLGSLADKPNVRVCDLNSGSDLLEGDLGDCDLLMMSSLCYAPHKHELGAEFSRQSPHVNKPESWHKAFSESGAKVISNMAFSWDRSSREGLFYLVEDSGHYKHVASDKNLKSVEFSYLKEDPTETIIGNKTIDTFVLNK